MASSAASEAPPVVEARTPEARLAASESGGWLLGPWSDALFIANVGWPLLLLLQVSEGFGGPEGIRFWQVYFLTTPHRWITLALVFFDRQQMRKRGGLFAAIAVAVVAVCLGVRLTTGTLMCLLTIDYVWNAWHFASQHHGVYRVYARQGEKGSGSGLVLEKWGLRLLLLYVILRVAGATWSYPRVEQTMQALDWVAVVAAGWFAVREAMQRRNGARSLYLCSVLGLYMSLLMAVHFRQPAAVVSLATASAMFHATEYLGLVTWSVRQRSGAMPGELGALSYLAARWAVVLLLFVVILGAGGWLLDQNFLRPWLLLNVIVAFLHYAYDGLLWRRGGGARAAASANAGIAAAG